MTIPGILEEKLSAALKAVLGEELPADFCASVTPSADLRFGDYQSNAAMVLAKRCRTNPRALAQQVVDRMGQDGVCSLEIAGPGFINFRIKPEFYAARLLAMLADDSVDGGALAKAAEHLAEPELLDLKRVYEAQAARRFPPAPQLRSRGTARTEDETEFLI